MENNAVRQQGGYPVQTYGLYHSENEHDACGVGLVADLNNIPSHQIVLHGLTVLKNLMHRGAAGCDPETGDGAGLLLALPDQFFRREIPQLPPRGQYGVAMIFGGVGQAEIEAIVAGKGGRVIGWRTVPVDKSAIGRSARQTCPEIRQLFIGGETFEDQDVFERKLFVIRRLIEKQLPGNYICSCSSRSIVYKGLLLATQLEHFYTDLADELFQSPLALVHQRYSTNTFPTWNLAHPFRYLAHNGEINTLRGNLNQLAAREPYLQSNLLGDDIADLLPLITPGQSDSASLDNMFELLLASGRSLCHTMLMLIPQAWGKKYHMGRDVRSFFEYHSALMEPWDGPAAVAFSDGVNAGAILDRNGLRPARYTLTADNLFVLASETGVLDLPAARVVAKGRLKPGEIIYCDLENHRLIRDAEIKNLVARRRPYRRWVEENRISVHGLFSTLTPSEPKADLLERQKLFGYSREDLELILKPMAANGREPIGSMGNDAALAVLSERPQLLFNYFKQLFAQVTNPPIDPIREELVMSLTTYIGNQGNIMIETPEHARLIKLPRPVLTNDELNRLRQVHQSGFQSGTLPLGFANSLAEALDELCNAAISMVKNGKRILILSDRELSSEMAPIPSLLAVAAVNRALVQTGIRCDAGLIVESGEIREIMHFALLLGYGATAINPYLALESVGDLVRRGEVPADAVTAAGNYINAVDKGLLKVMSKMGISTLRSYRSGQLFEAVGLDRSVIDRYFPGTASRIGGIDLPAIEQEIKKRLAEIRRESALLPSGGQYRYRQDGEQHLWTPGSLSTFRQAVQNNDPAKYREYAALINQQAAHLCTLRGLFEFAPARPVPIDEVESVEAIVRRFVSGAMSLGSLSPEAHEAIAVAMNRLGAMSNCGEGGEDPARYQPGPDGEDRCSAIKQIASGRFGVTIDYLRHAKELQIKMAQGAKPGEGGQLPGHKVDEFIARIRHSMPQVSLISPPPHHDIYSIEDLAQLIYDLRNANPQARVSVKLVSEVGVGTVAAGVAKAHADVVLISGHDGGTGASPLTSIKHAGLPWELGLAEAQQTLVLNQLRDRVKLQVDGQLKTGRDVVIAALLGAEEFGFATTILVCLGCVMMRKCHENSCPVGVATQDPALRKCFKGKPEYIENFLRLLAQEVREYLAQLGLRSLSEAVGRSDLLLVNQAIDFYKTRNLDFSGLLTPAAGGEIRYQPTTREPLVNFDRTELLGALQPALTAGQRQELARTLHNINRTVGTELSGEVDSRYGAAGLPEDSIKVHFSGCAGQSFGAFLAPGITFELSGEANDFVGKGLSGGKIIIRPPADAAFPAAGNVIAGNVIGYGGTSGTILLAGQAGERFAIRNSGMTMVVEGIGDHGCEYMTGGRVVVLGPTGVNFAAGMTGGLAYVLDETNDFDLRCNPETVDLETIEPHSEDEQELLRLLRLHQQATGSRKAAEILEDFENRRNQFVKVFPVEYRLALAQRNNR
ncbi:glutamate synthase large subunit [Victivallis sp. Marseille-Q1083]|uniref:glutamate synthase large subunit n=1 Tax=Victivallis sp. Marseille-Q1083 TaxID=2717288 RepID=UPI00158AB76A|nr:glutamate synthase large subunit [Victivallis sp. Marseille-Q1083]